METYIVYGLISVMLNNVTIVLGDDLVTEELINRCCSTSLLNYATIYQILVKVIQDPPACCCVVSKNSLPKEFFWGQSSTVDTSKLLSFILFSRRWINLRLSRASCRC